MTGSVRVLVVDDQPLIRHSLRLIVDGAPDLAVVGEADTGGSALERARELRPDIVLMDLRMPGGDGIEATRRIAADPALARTRVLVLTMFELDEYVHAALGAGASGFLLKDAEPARLTDAIRRTHAGESLFAPSVLARLVENYLSRSAPASAPASLTDREAQVLTLVGRGLSNDEITQALTISMGTVKTHIGSLLSKLHARDRAQLVIAAYEHGLVGAGARSPR
ncbi:response regulator transcription factor [Occultella aeris]|uniref:Response regulator protein VraR n=1 Tax=Occultella aeris TaxID=2761496 RepID=A0A7M4DPW1_9MICO|nr:response regulator transcription factor [Occultella aeris]VZO39505.1 Response regulator protein VraR [Occultella aeris]